MTKKEFNGCDVVAFYEASCSPNNRAHEIWLECAKKAGFDDIVYYETPEDNCINYEGNLISAKIKCGTIMRRNGSEKVNKDNISIVFYIDGLELNKIYVREECMLDIDEMLNLKAKIEKFLEYQNIEGLKLKEELNISDDAMYEYCYG